MLTRSLSWSGLIYNNLKANYSFLFKDIYTDTIDNNFIENVVDEPQMILEVILDDIDVIKIVET